MEAPDFPQNLCRTPEDFEAAALAWIKHWGFEDARMTGKGPDGGIDVESRAIVAQVKAHMVPVGSPEIQRLKGLAHDGRLPIFFSLMHYTDSAIEFADVAEVALFRFSGYDGSIEPVNGYARDLASRRRGSGPPKFERQILEEFGDINEIVLDTLSRMAEDDRQFCIISANRTKNRYVQFTTLKDGRIYGETVGPGLLDDDEALTQEDAGAIRGLGWINPSDANQNFYNEWPSGVPLEEIATIAVMTLVRVHGVRDPTDIDITIDA